MSIDYIVSSLPTLAFNAPAPLSWEAFVSRGGVVSAPQAKAWRDLETQLRNAVAEARGGERFKRPADGCSLYWKNRVWWDAADELTPPSEPLGKGALATYAIRLKIVLKRTRISKDTGNASFDRLTAETKR